LARRSANGSRRSRVTSSTCDAAWVGGLIAGGRFQAPLREGAHVMTGSTYKSFGGPAAGMVLTDDAGIAERPDRVPGVVGKLRYRPPGGVGAGRADLVAFGAVYADAQIGNAQLLAGALDERGVDVVSVAGRGYTASQHVAVRPPAGMTAADAARRLAEAGILTSVIGLPDGEGLRLGSQELTRRAVTAGQLRRVATLVARVLVAGDDPAVVAEDATVLRRELVGPAFIR
jgi:glycine hydroxymethyltransferase